MGAPVDIEEVRRSRVAGEPLRVRYNPVVHPGLVYRLYSRGDGHDMVAAALGVEPAILDSWLVTYPEMEQAREKALSRDAEILASLEDAAIGHKDPETGRWVGQNASLLKHLVQCRLGMIVPKAAPPPAEEEKFDGMNAGQLRRQAEVLAKKLERVEALRSAPTAGGPGAAGGSRR